MKRFSTVILMGTLLSAGSAMAAYDSSADTVTYRTQTNMEAGANTYQPTTNYNSNVQSRTTVNGDVARTGDMTRTMDRMDRRATVDTSANANVVANTATTGNEQMLSGGTSSESRAMLQSLENQYNTKLVFTGKNGAYLANVGVDVRDSSGNTVMESTTDGPILLMNLPQGRYTVSANAEGFNEQQSITVGSRGTSTQHMRFPVGDDDYASPNY